MPTPSWPRMVPGRMPLKLPRTRCRSVPQMAETLRRTIASVGASRTGSATSSRRMSPTPWNTTAFMPYPPESWRWGNRPSASVMNSDWRLAAWFSFFTLQPQQQDRAPGQQKLAFKGMLLAVAQFRPIGVQQAQPVAAAGNLGQAEADHVVVRIEQQQQGGVVAASADPGGLGASVQQHAQTAGMRVIPLFVAHGIAGGGKPGDVVDVQLLVVLADQGPARSEERVLVAQADQIAGELQQFTAVVVQVPVDPADFVVLTVDVVVALL